MYNEHLELWQIHYESYYFNWKIKVIDFKLFNNANTGYSITIVVGRCWLSLKGLECPWYIKMDTGVL